MGRWGDGEMGEMGEMGWARDLLVVLRGGRGEEDKTEEDSEARDRKTAREAVESQVGWLRNQSEMQKRPGIVLSRQRTKRGT
jgi:hypothetical protein